MALLGRDTQVKGPVPDGTFLLETLQGKETLGLPYSYSLTLLSDDPAITADSVLGQHMAVAIKLDTGDFRHFSGIVTYFAKTGMAMRHTRYAAVLSPKLTVFDCTRECRIFFDQKSPDLATEVLAQRGYSDVDDKLNGDYRKREFTVQYRESDFNFIQRLFEEDGIYYFFRHEKDKHTMVLADATTAHAKVSGYESILYLPKQRRQAREEEHFWSLRVSGALYPGKFSVLRTYDHTKARPMGAQVENATSTDAQPGADFEDYDNPGGSTTKSYVEADANVRLESHYATNTLIEVEGNTMGLGVGDLLSLRKPLSPGADYNPFWSEDDFKKEYLITSASYSISINQYETGDTAESDEPFKATYTLFDSQLQFRPPRTAHKPRIEGPQTALVVGPGGEEIHTDKLGRVKVQFDWDRLGALDDHSSIWVRVAQIWAGRQWGAIHIPRIGQEVIVEFLDGDPDRPIITGRVYNADSMPPYSLPDNKTQSGIKSRSSKGGSASNFNELRFEDLKGSEEVFLQAEKDLNILVKSNETREVGHDRTKHVVHDETTNIDENRTETVGKDETITIQGGRNETVGSDESITIGGSRTETVGKDESLSVGGNRSKSVGGSESVTVASVLAVTVGQHEVDTIGGSRQVEVAQADALTVGGSRTLSVSGDNKLQVAKKVLIDGGSEIMLKSGSASITLKKDGTIIIKGKDVSVKGSGKINIKASSDLIMKGSKVSGN